MISLLLNWDSHCLLTLDFADDEVVEEVSVQDCLHCACGHSNAADPPFFEVPENPVYVLPVEQIHGPVPTHAEHIV